MSTARPSMATELALLLLLASLWGASYTFIKIGVETIPPITLIAARTLIAGVILLAVMRWRGLRCRRDAATWRRFLFQACLNSVDPLHADRLGRDTSMPDLRPSSTPPSPIFAFLMTAARHASRAGDGAQAVRRRGRHRRHLPDRRHGGVRRARPRLLPQLAVVAATVSYAGAAIFGRGFKGLDPIMPAAGSMMCGAAILIPISLWSTSRGRSTPSALRSWRLLGLSVFSTALAFVIFFRLIHTLGTVGTTAQAYLRVPIGVGIGALFLGETLALDRLGRHGVRRRRRRRHDHPGTSPR